MGVRILTEAELRRLVPLDLAAVAAVEGGFLALAEGGVVMPPVLSMEITEFNGEVDVKTAYVPGLDSFAIKISPGFFDNPKLGLPSTSGLMVLFAVRTGQVEALSARQRLPHGCADGGGGGGCGALAGAR